MKITNLFLALLMLGTGATLPLSAHAILREGASIKNAWTITHYGQTAFNGLDVLVSLEEIPAGTIAEKTLGGFKINAANTALGNIVFQPIEQKAYRLGLRALNQPELTVFFALDRISGDQFVSSRNNTNDDFSFTVSGNEGETLTVNYLRYENSQIIESGSFELNPLVTLQRR